MSLSIAAPASSINNVSVTAETIALNANISTDRGAVSLTGNVLLGSSVTIDTEQGDDNNAGSVTFAEMTDEHAR